MTWRVPLYRIRGIGPAGTFAEAAAARATLSPGS
jgi:hypothetical protein